MIALAFLYRLSSRGPTLGMTGVAQTITDMRYIGLRISAMISLCLMGAKPTEWSTARV